MAVSTVYACVSIRSQDVARCALAPSVYRLGEDGSRKVVNNHWLISLLRRPNPVQTGFEMVEMMHAGLLLRGNCYAAIIRDRHGKPKMLIPINPDCVQTIEYPGGYIFYSVSRFGLWLQSMLGDFPGMIPGEDMLHIRGLSFNATMGLSRIHLARDAIALAMAQEQQAGRFIANGARPSGVLKSNKSLTEEAADRMRTRWEQFTAGLLNVGRTLILEDGMEWQSVQMTSVDLEFLKSRDHQVEEVARWFDVPMYRLGRQEPGRVTLAERQQAYVNDTVMPDLDRWETKLAAALLDDDSLYVDFDEARLLRADFTTRYNGYRIGLLSGFLSPNEVRRAEGLPPVPGGDEVFRPLNMAALGSDMTGTAPDGAGRPEDGDLPADAVPTGVEDVVSTASFEGFMVRVFQEAAKRGLILVPRGA